MRMPRLFIVSVTVLGFWASNALAQAAGPCLDPIEAPPDKAVITLHRTNGPAHVSVWHEDRFLTLLAAGTAIQIEIEPGEHLFIGSFGARGKKGAVVAVVEAGKSYDVLVKTNLALAVSLVPVTRGAKSWERVPRRLESECLVGMMFPGMPEFSVAIEPPIDEVIRRFRTGDWKERLARLEADDGR
jgi:hypothetical protein